MKIYEVVIPNKWPFTFEKVDGYLINIEECPIAKTEDWWSKDNGWHKKYNYTIVDDIKTITYRTRIVFPTYCVAKSEYDYFIFTDQLEEMMQYHERNENTLGKTLYINIIKKDWDDHWEIGFGYTEEIVKDGILLTEVDNIFR